jgi:hypothetical protein
VSYNDTVPVAQVIYPQTVRQDGSISITAGLETEAVRGMFQNFVAKMRKGES